MTFVNSQMMSRLFSVHGVEGSALNFYIGHTPSQSHQVEYFTPIGTLIFNLFQRLAWEDPSLRNLADYYRLVGLAGSGEGNFRPWPSSIYSESVRPRAETGPLSTGPASFWDEWSLNFI